MSGNQSKSLIYYVNDPLADRIQSLDPNGFTVGHPASEDATARITCVNHTGVKYHWTAFRAAAGEMALGTYTGNGGPTLDVTGLGFTPDYVIAMPILTGWSQARTSLMPAGDSYDFEGVQWMTAVTTLLADGFRVGNDTDTNTFDSLHHYVAWKEVAGRMDVGTYVGTGVDPLNIATVGFLPANVFLNSGYMKPVTTGATVDRSMPFRCFNNCGLANYIQQLLSNGFQLGGNTNVNTGAFPYYWAAFAAPDVEQVHTRWRNDDASEAAATWAAAEDMALAGVPVASTRRLRFELANLGGIAADPTAFALQVAETATCATGTYTGVTTGAGAWQIVDSDVPDRRRGDDQRGRRPDRRGHDVRGRAR